SRHTYLRLRGSLAALAGHLPQRHAQAHQQRAATVVVAAADRECNVHALAFLALVQVDIRYTRLLAEAHVVVAATVNAPRVQALEVADTRHRDADQLLKEEPHPVTAQRHLGAHGVAFAQLEGGRGGLGFADHGLLARELG